MRIHPSCWISATKILQGYTWENTEFIDNSHLLTLESINVEFSYQFSLKQTDLLCFRTGTASLCQRSTRPSLQGCSDTSENSSCVPKHKVNVSSVSKNRSLWTTCVHAMNSISIPNTNGAEITFLNPFNSATGLTWSEYASIFLHIIQLLLDIKSFWLIRPGRKSKLLFSGSQGFNLLFQCQWVCFLGILRLLHCKNFLFSLSLPEVSGICSLCRLVLTSAAFQKEEPILKIHTWIFICS